MTIEEQLKAEILSQYKSVRAFTTAINIPYTTLDSVFKRGIGKAGIDTMIKVFNALGLEIESIPTGTLRQKKSPTPEGLGAEDLLTEKEKKEFLLFRQALIALGYVGENDDFTEAQAAIVDGVVQILDAAFPRRLNQGVDDTRSVG
jgi:hypothetical protein